MLIVDFFVCVFSYSQPRIHIAASLDNTAKCFQTKGKQKVLEDYLFLHKYKNIF